jgi:hypothetical protein
MSMVWMKGLVMPSLMQCVLEDISGPSQLTEEEFLATFSLDGNAIADVDGGWERVPIPDHSHPRHHDMVVNDFKLDGPSVYEMNGYMIVRGQKDDRAVWFMYEPIGMGVH